MAVKKDRIYIGDSYRLSYVCYKRDPNARGNQRTPIEPLGAVVRVWNVIEGSYVPLGFDDDIEADATVVGNRVDYVLDGTLLEVNGDYKAFLTVDFEAGDDIVDTRTVARPFRVLPKE